jgi:hypothetical protein
MAFTTTTVSASADDLARHRSAGFASNPADNIRSRSSAVSWGAVAAGAAAAAALSLILLILGVGLGLSSVSPWATEGVTASTFGLSTILWLTLTQLAASAMGGYLAGRLRTKWSDVHTDEVYFRDTAHGFLAWAVASLATVLEAEVAAREAADKARKASAYGALWLFVSLLIGAFFASLSATFGGRRRDA